MTRPTSFLLSFLALIWMTRTRSSTPPPVTVIPDCPRDEGWTCQWDFDYWKATSNVSAYDKVTITYEESPTRSVSIVCGEEDDEASGLSAGFSLPAGFLRNFTLGSTTDYFRFLRCPAPPEGSPSLGEILDGQLVKMLRFTTGRAVVEDDHWLDGRIFDNLTDLRYLSLAANSLPSISSDIFRRLPNLKTVNLKDNELTSLRGDLFEGIGNLVHLELGNNNLTRLDEPVSGLLSLQTLNVYHNQIESVSADFFASTPSLKSVDLQGNHLESLPAGVFATLTELRTLRLFSNRLTSLPSDLLRPLRQLEHFDVSDNPQLGAVPDDLFQNLTSTSLFEVNLRRCGLRTLPVHLLDNCSSMRTLHLDRNNLTELEPQTFAGTPKLLTLDLRRNRMESLRSGVFNALTELQTLYVNRNRIGQIAPSAFYDMAALKSLDLSRNQLAEIPEDLFQPTLSLETLNLGHNMLSNVHRGPTIFAVPHTIRWLDLQDNRFAGLPSAWITENTLLVHLDLSHNRLDHFDASDCQPTSDNITVDLRHNNISRVFVDLQWAAVLAQMNSKPRPQTPVVHLGHNPLVCDCLAANLLEYVAGDLHVFLITLDIAELECHAPVDLESRALASIRLDQLVCDEPTDCPWPCGCRKHAAGNLIEMDCRGSNLTSWPATAPFNVSVLRLDDNRLTSAGRMAPNIWENLTELHLSRNDIASLDDVQWLPSGLRVLDVRSNSLKAIGDNLLSLLDNVTTPYRATGGGDKDRGRQRRHQLQEVWLDDNPWRCDCGAKGLKDWLNINGKRVGNLSAMRCHPDGSIPLFKANVCPLPDNSKEVLIAATAVSFAMAVVLAMAGIGYYRYKREIKVWLYAHQWCMWFVTETELDRDKTYDAFISFSQEDSEFVASHLLPGLEGSPIASSHIHNHSHSKEQSSMSSSSCDHHSHHPAYKVCIHYRDWLAGEWISEQIIRSVQDSRRTIVVLSKNFIKSVWGRLEFKAAHHQALQDRTNRIIIVVYGELPSIAEMDAELNMYVKFNTYLKWDDPWFWQKLRYAMPHRPLSCGGNSSAKPTSWSSTNLALSPRPIGTVTPVSVQPQMTTLRSLSSSSSTSSTTTTATTLSDVNTLCEDKLGLVKT